MARIQPINTDNDVDYEREQQAAGESYARYLECRGISEAEHQKEIGEWLDDQD